MRTGNTDKQSLFSWRTALLALLIGVISFSALVVLSAFAPDLEDKDYAGPHAYSKSALGYNFAVELLKRTDHIVEISRDPDLLEKKDGYGLLVVTPASSRDLKELEQVEFDRYDPTLIVLPKRWGYASFAEKRHQARVGELSMQDVTKLLQPLDDALGMRRVSAAEQVQFEGRSFPVKFKDRTQLITSGPVVPIIDTDEGVIFGRLEDTNVYILADPELMNTHGLTSVDNAALMIDMFDYIQGDYDFDIEIVFDTTLHGFERTRNLLRTLFEPPLLGATLFAFAASVLLGWAAFVRFGKAPEPEPFLKTGRLTLIDSTAGLFTQTERELSVTEEYGEIVERLAVAELGYPDDLTRPQIKTILGQLDERRETGKDPYSHRPDIEAVKTRGQLLSFAKTYQKWKRDLSHGRQ